MEKFELKNLWKSHNQKLNRILVINKKIAVDLTRHKFNKQIRRLNLPKWIAIIIEIPYTFIIVTITVIASMAKVYFVALGFGAISLVMILTLIIYLYQLYLISQIQSNEDILSTQQQLSKLKISSFNSLSLAIYQLPFWTICWISIKALKESPVVYGGINLLIIFLFAYFSYRIYNDIIYKNKESKIRNLFLSGIEWDPIIKSAEILEQIKEYDK